jgi:hypothetical protein
VLVRKREELACVLEQQRTPGLHQGIARELRKHVAILNREIADEAGLIRSRLSVRLKDIVADLLQSAAHASSKSAMPGSGGHLSIWSVFTNIQ